jgi:hypothetical protein
MLYSCFAPALLLLYSCFAPALLLKIGVTFTTLMLYHCFTPALLFLYYCFYCFRQTAGKQLSLLQTAYKQLSKALKRQ